MRRLKIKVVGDGSVGKTSFLIRWYNENFACEDDTPLFPGRARILPAVQDPFFTNMTVDRVSYVLTFWDTICGADFLKFRPMEYEETDVFLVFFDISNPSSFQNVSTVWVPELKHFMPTTPILVVGNKTDLRTASTAPDGMITIAKGRELAERLGTRYCESSAETGDGVHSVIDTAVRLAVMNQTPSKTKFKMFQWQRKTPKMLRHGPEPPVLSPPDPMPQVKILPSTFTDDMKKMCRDETGNSDIRLLFSSNNHPLEAHKLILCIGSAVFRDFFLNSGEEVELSRLLSTADSCSCPASREFNRPIGKKGNMKEVFGTNLCSVINHQRLDFAPNLEGKPKTKTKTCLHFNNSVSGKAFQHVLEFLYTGSPNITSDTDESLLTKVMSLSHRLRIPWLGQICENMTNGESYLNPSMVTILHEERSKIMKENFINKPHFSDVIFHVQNTVLYAHRAVLMARSEVMAAMFGGGFSEKDSLEVTIKVTTVKSFLALLVFLYTDTVPTNVTVSDYRELLVLADRFCLPQLISVCEGAIVDRISTEIKKKRLNSAQCNDVINLLLTGQAHNAPQLARWCLYLITTNYSDFEACDDFDLIKGDNRRHVLEHRWPPLAYLKELEEFKRKTGRA